MLTIYKASAGSGKTFTLTQEYIKLLLGVKNTNDANGAYTLNHKDFRDNVERNRHRHILAITFTNKATEEMKTRIIDELVAISKSTDTDKKSDYIDPFTKKTFGCTVAQLAQTAKSALYQLLVDFDNFNVSTIDSFFQQVLRSLAYELDYPGNYEVVISTDPVTTQAVDMMLDDINFNDSREDTKQLRGILKKFMREQYERGSAFNIFNRNLDVHKKLVDKVSTLFDEKYQLIADDFEKWYNSDPNAIKKFGDELIKWQKQLLADNIADADALLNSLTATFSEREYKLDFPKLINRFKLPPKDFMKYAWDNKSDIIGQLDEGLDPAKMLKKAGLDSDRAAHCAAYAHSLHTMLHRIFQYYDAQNLYDEIATYSFMRFTDKYISQIRDDNNIVVLADTNELLHNVMKDSGEVPFIYEKMGVNLHNFLIDEFQDTSQLQWNNLRELVYTGIAEGEDSLIIGDEKQAIYRFRNSDSSMLHSSVAEETIDRGQELNEHGSDTNWRSSSEVVRFNNSFFARTANALNIEGYENVVQRVASKNQKLHGYIRFQNIPADGILDPEAVQPDEDDPNTTDDDYIRIDQLEVMTREIKRQHAAGYPWSRIAVLVDKRKQGVLVVDKLLSEKLPVITDEALLLCNCQTIRTIVSIMQLVVNAKEKQLADQQGISPDDKATHKYKQFASDQVSKFEFEYVNNIQRGVDKDTAIANAVQAAFDASHTAALDDVAEIAASNPSTMYTLVETIINKRIPEHQRLNDMAYIAAFQDVVMEYVANYGNNIVAFIKWWETASRKLTVNSPDDVDAIKIMTIHKSKGLEFDCVHIPFASWTLEGSKSKTDSVWIDAKNPAYTAVMPQSLIDALPPHARISLNKFTSSAQSLFNKSYNTNMQERRVDGFNKTYVAYTRAKRELFVYYDIDDNRGNNFGAQIMDAHLLPDNINDDSLSLDLGQYTDGEGNYTIGAPTTPKDDDINKKQKQVYTNGITPEVLFGKYNANFEGPGKCITSVEMLMDDSGSLDDDPQKQLSLRQMQDAAEHGERLHFMLSRMERLNDLERAKRPTFFFKFSDQDKADLDAIFNNPANRQYVDRWFVNHKRVLNEMTIFDPDAPVGEQKVRRPDRIVWHKDGSIDIVDYKFTVQDKKELLDYSKQVRTYMHLVQRMCPDATIRGFIWYALHGTVVPVEI